MGEGREISIQSIAHGLIIRNSNLKSACSLNNQIGAGYEAELLQRLAKELVVEDFAREVLREGQDWGSSFLRHSCCYLKQCSVCRERLHDAPAWGLQSQPCLTVCCSSWLSLCRSSCGSRRTSRARLCPSFTPCLFSFSLLPPSLLICFDLRLDPGFRLCVF